jgi:hypothetical protein
VLLWFSESPENVKRTAALVESTVLHLGLVLTLPTPEERADWSTARAGGARLDVLALDLLIDARYFARF